MRKKGDVISLQTVLIISAVVGLAIILVLLYKFIRTENIDREVCHESVILRATIPDLPLVKTKDVTPLKCKTRKVCIVKGGLINSIKRVFKSECDEFKGEKYDIAVVSGDTEEIKRQIRMFLAREMADCWAMMGEGKIHIFSKETGFGVLKKCLLCSRIAFGNSIKNDPELQEIEGLFKYMITHKVPNKDVTYWEFITGSQTSSEVIIKNNPSILEKDVIYTNTEKSIIFIEFQNRDIRWIGTVIGAATGKIGGAAAGAAIGATIGSAVPVFGTVIGGAIGSGVGFILGNGLAVAGGYGGYYAADKINEIISGKGYVKEKSGVIAAQFFTDTRNIPNFQCDTFENIP